MSKLKDILRMIPDNFRCIPSLGLSDLDPCKVLLEQHVQNRPYTIFKGYDGNVCAAEEANTQQRLVDKRMRMSHEKVKLFGEVTRRRVKSIDPSNVGKVERESEYLQYPTSENQIKTMFEVAFEKTPAAIAMVFMFTYGGELYMRMKQIGKMSETESKFYICELALAIHYLQDKMKIVYRDLKPENILIDSEGHVKLCDFGFACPLSDVAQLSDCCGTAMYLAPEIASGHSHSSHGYPVDWWGLGCVLFELVVGTAPFGDTDTNNKFEILNSINSKTVRFPFSMSRSLKNLLSGLLCRDPKRRFKWHDFKNSPWCTEVNFADLLNGKVPAPWVPSPSDKPSTKNFLQWNEIRVPTLPATSEAMDYTCGNINTENNIRVNRSNNSYDRNLILKKRSSSTDRIAKSSHSLHTPVVQSNSPLISNINGYFNRGLNNEMNGNLGMNLNGNVNDSSFDQPMSRGSRPQTGSSSSLVISGSSSGNYRRGATDGNHELMAKSGGGYTGSSGTVHRKKRSKDILRKRSKAFSSHRRNNNVYSDAHFDGDSKEDSSHRQVDIPSMGLRRSFEEHKHHKLPDTRKHKSFNDGIESSFFTNDFVPSYSHFPKSQSKSKSYEF